MDISTLIPIVAAVLGAVAGALLNAVFTARRASKEHQLTAETANRERQLTARINSANTELEKNRADREVCERLGEDLADWYNALSELLQDQWISDELSETTQMKFIQFTNRIDFERRVPVQTAKLVGEPLYEGLVAKALDFQRETLDQKSLLMLQQSWYLDRRRRALELLKENYNDFQDELRKVIEQLNQRDKELRKVLQDAS